MVRTVGLPIQLVDSWKRGNRLAIFYNILILLLLKMIINLSNLAPFSIGISECQPKCDTNDHAQDRREQQRILLRDARHLKTVFSTKYEWYIFNWRLSITDQRNDNISNFIKFRNIRYIYAGCRSLKLKIL